MKSIRKWQLLTLITSVFFLFGCGISPKQTADLTALSESVIEGGGRSDSLLRDLRHDIVQYSVSRHALSSNFPIEHDLKLGTRIPVDLYIQDEDLLPAIKLAGTLEDYGELLKALVNVDDRDAIKEAAENLSSNISSASFGEDIQNTDAISSFATGLGSLIAKYRVKRSLRSVDSSFASTIEISTPLLLKAVYLGNSSACSPTAPDRFFDPTGERGFRAPHLEEISLDEELVRAVMSIRTASGHEDVQADMPLADILPRAIEYLSESFVESKCEAMRYAKDKAFATLRDPSSSFEKRLYAMQIYAKLLVESERTWKESRALSGILNTLFVNRHLIQAVLDERDFSIDLIKSYKQDLKDLSEVREVY